VDFSKLKLEVYDFLGLILPGLIAICEGWILLRGWQPFLAAINQLGATGFTLLLLFAFCIGNVVQELGDVTVKNLKGQRYFRSGRDRFWLTADAEVVRNSIKKDLGHQIESVDTAFDYCLTKLKDRFGKREIFLATSDLSRSFVVLSAVALAPLVRVAFYDLRPLANSCIVAALLIAVLATVSSVMWRRMVRFRELSEITVFRSYLALAKESEIDAGASTLSVPPSSQT
jgi:hypothetical protein